MDIPALQDAVDACMTAIVEELRTIGVYAIDKCVQPDAADTVYLANGCSGQTFQGITAISVPTGGLAILTR